MKCASASRWKKWWIGCRGNGDRHRSKKHLSNVLHCMLHRVQLRHTQAQKKLGNRMVKLNHHPLIPLIPISRRKVPVLETSSTELTLILLLCFCFVAIYTTQRNVLNDLHTDFKFSSVLSLGYVEPAYHLSPNNSSDT